MSEEKFIKLVEENGGFEFYQAYRDDVDHVLGGKGDTYWYVIMKKGKAKESYIGKNSGGAWEISASKAAAQAKRQKPCPPAVRSSESPKRRI